MSRCSRALTALVLLWVGAAVAAGPEVVDLPTRAGVAERILVEQPEQASTAVLVSITGGAGRLGIFDNGIEAKVTGNIAAWIASQRQPIR